MGTPDFAVEAWRQLVEGGYNVVGVITMPDKPAGRGHKIQYSPVKQYAVSYTHLDVYKRQDTVFQRSDNLLTCHAGIYGERFDSAFAQILHLV